MNDHTNDDVINALRSAGTAGPAFAMTPLAETVRRGKRARRRRITATAAGTFVGLAGMAALAVTAAGLWDSDITTGPLPASAPSSTATQPPDPSPTPSLTPEPTATTTSTVQTPDDQARLNRTTMLDALPPGFVEVTEENLDEVGHMTDLAVAQEPPVNDGIPEGMRAGLRLMTFVAGEIDLNADVGICSALDEKGTTSSACVQRQVGGVAVSTKESVQPGTQVGTRGRMAWLSTRVFYEQPDGDVILLDVYVWTDDNYGWAGVGEELDADQRANARQWIDDNLADLTAPIADPAIQPPVRAAE